MAASPLAMSATYWDSAEDREIVSLSFSKPTPCLEKQEGLRKSGNLPRVKIPGRPVSDSSRIVAGTARRPALFPELFPVPDPGHHLVRQPESELMREHTHLPAMVGFMRKHVAQHFRANRPRPGPAVSAKLLDAAPTTAKRFSEHLRAASGALGQSRTGLLRRAVRAVELSWNLQMRSCKPDPLASDIVHVREDRRNGAGLAGRFGCPGGRVKVFDENLVHAIIGGKDPDCGSAELSVSAWVDAWSRIPAP